MRAPRGGGDEEIDLLRREEVEATRVAGFVQPPDLRCDVDGEAEVFDGVLEDRVGLGGDLVDRLAGARPVFGEPVTPALDLFCGDRLDAAGPELGQQVGVEHRAIVALGRRRPVARQRPRVHTSPRRRRRTWRRCAAGLAARRRGSLPAAPQRRACAGSLAGGGLGSSRLGRGASRAGPYGPATSRTTSADACPGRAARDR